MAGIIGAEKILENWLVERCNKLISWDARGDN